MRWQCEHCKRDFSKPNALTQHISRKHPWIKDSSASTTLDIDHSTFLVDDELWQVPQIASPSSIPVDDDLWQVPERDLPSNFLVDELDISVYKLTFSLKH